MQASPPPATREPGVAVAACANCGATLSGTRYCGECGQPAHVHRIGIGHFLHELSHALFHADRSVLALTAALARRPGQVVREYLQGRRRHWFNPFAYLLLVAALSTLSLQAGRQFLAPAPAPPAAAAQAASETTAVVTSDPAASARQARRARAEAATAFVGKQQNVIMLLAVPFHAAIFWLALWRRRIRYAEHLVANVFLVGFLMLFTALIFYPALAWLRTGPAHVGVLTAMLLAHAGYYLVGYGQWLQLQRARDWLYLGLVTLFALGAWGALTQALIRRYIAG